MKTLACIVIAATGLPVLAASVAGHISDTSFWLMLLLYLCYWIPTVMAFHFQHHNWRAIFLVNFLLGWTFIGWVVALVWSFMQPAPRGQ